MVWLRSAHRHGTGAMLEAFLQLMNEPLLYRDWPRLLLLLLLLAQLLRCMPRSGLGDTLPMIPCRLNVLISTTTKSTRSCNSSPGSTRMQLPRLFRVLPGPAPAPAATQAFLHQWGRWLRGRHGDRLRYIYYSLPERCVLLRTAGELCW